VSAQDRTEPDEDDDTFDVKMRMKFQKKSRSSGRRHTVANIGLPSLSRRLRRGSLSDTGLTAVAGISPSGSGSGATTPEYHYVRKSHTFPPRHLSYNTSLPPRQTTVNTSPQRVPPP